jgi:hypothetical protein
MSDKLKDENRRLKLENRRLLIYKSAILHMCSHRLKDVDNYIMMAKQSVADFEASEGKDDVRPYIKFAKETLENEYKITLKDDDNV